MKTTTCSKCKQRFASTEANFYYNNRTKKYYTWCKDCHKKMTALRDRRKKNHARPLSEDPLEDKFIRLRRTLIQRNKKHNCDAITTRELLDMHTKQTSKCHYTGLQYSLTERGPLYMSVDRIDSSLGYTKDNTVLCCWFVNCAKNEWSLDQMKELWKYLPTN